MEELNLDNIINIKFYDEFGNVRVLFEDNNVLFASQDKSNLMNYVRNNFKFVLDNFKRNSIGYSNIKDLYSISIIVTLHYLYIKSKYTKRTVEIDIHETDLNNPQTFDIVYNYFYKNYTNECKEKCIMFLNINNNVFEELLNQRLDFYNK